MVTLAARPEASLILVLGTPQRIVIASDSLVHSFDENGRVTTVPKSRLSARAGCKIAVAGALVVGYGGLGNPFVNNRGALEVWRSLTDLSNESPGQRANRLINALIGEPLRWRATAAVSVAVAGFDGRVPVVAVAELRASQGASHFAIHRREGSTDEPFFFVSLIEIESIDSDSILRRLRSTKNDQEVITLAQRVINEQSKRTPGLVGGPIDTAIIHPGTSARWVNVKSECR